MTKEEAITHIKENYDVTNMEDKEAIEALIEIAENTGGVFRKRPYRVQKAMDYLKGLYGDFGRLQKNVQIVTNYIGTLENDSPTSYWKLWNKDIWQCANCGDLFNIKQGKALSEGYTYCPSCGIKLTDNKWMMNVYADIQSLPELIKYKGEHIPNWVAFTYKENDNIVEKTFLDFYNDVKKCANYIISEIGTNKHIAIMGANSYEWILSYSAIISSGNIAVPFNKDFSQEEIDKYIDKFDIDYSFISREHIDKFNDYIIILEDLQFLISRHSIEFDIKIEDIDAIESIFLTSGTSGEQKGVMLSHRNLYVQVKQNIYNHIVYITNKDEFKRALAMLPFHHTFAINVGIFYPMSIGMNTYITKDISEVSDDMRSFNPNLITTVPLIIQGLYDMLLILIKQQHREKELEDIIKQYNEHDILANNKLFCDTFADLSPFGNDLFYIACGGANLKSEYIDKFKHIGMLFNFGYGTTECASAVTSNYEYDANSVGQLYLDAEYKFSDDKELLIKGPMIMSGYYNDIEETNKVLKDGWYHTGDTGFVDEDGRLHITGRLKNLIILSNGENVSPEEIENEYYNDIAVKEILVYSENDKIVAKIYPSKDYMDNEEYFINLRNKINEDKPIYKKVTNIYLQQEPLPKNSVCKIIRKEH